MTICMNINRQRHCSSDVSCSVVSLAAVTAYLTLLDSYSQIFPLANALSVIIEV